MTRRKETEWQKLWEGANCFTFSPDTSAQKFLNFDSAPFPNGSLHIGHLRNYVLGDIVARIKRLQGYNVIYTTNFDAFGLPNELSAEAKGIPPDKHVKSNVELVTRELKRLGISYDWSKTKITSDPDYYKWTQWIFLKLYAAGLVYYASVDLPWCPMCETTLSDMQVKEGRCWRCDSQVIQKAVRQWFVRTSRYSDQLYNSLAQLDGWSDRIKNMVRGYLGRAEGYLISASVLTPDAKIDISVFFQSGNTLSSATYVAACANHPSVVSAINISGGKCGVISKEDFETEVARIRQEMKNTPVPRMIRGARAHVFNTGLMVKVDDGLNTLLPLPLYIAGDLSMEYGASATFRFSSADKRSTANGKEPLENPECEPGRTASEVGQPHVQPKKISIYHVHDWPVSRQRSWGTPIPFIHCPKCGEVPLPEDRLPVLTQCHRQDYANNTVADSEKDVYSDEIRCFRCGTPALCDPDTLDCYFDDMWCFLSAVVDLNKGIAGLSPENAKLLPVDAYHGGFDIHLYLHLYRFFGHVMHALGYIESPELVVSHYGHDMVVSEGRKMSTHLGNAEPLRVLIDRYGADTLRLAIITAAAPDKPVRWNHSHIERAQTLIQKLETVWSLCSRQASDEIGNSLSIEEATKKKILNELGHTLSDMERFFDQYKPHAAMQSGMKMIKNLTAVCRHSADKPALRKEDRKFVADCLCDLVLAFSPVIPHICEEIWVSLEQNGLVAEKRWPSQNCGPNQYST